MALIILQIQIAVRVESAELLLPGALADASDWGSGRPSPLTSDRLTSPFLTLFAPPSTRLPSSTRHDFLIIMALIIFQIQIAVDDESGSAGASPWVPHPATPGLSFPRAVPRHPLATRHAPPVVASRLMQTQMPSLTLYPSRTTLHQLVSPATRPARTRPRQSKRPIRKSRNPSRRSRQTLPPDHPECDDPVEGSGSPSGTPAVRQAGRQPAQGTRQRADRGDGNQDRFTKRHGQDRYQPHEQDRRAGVCSAPREL
jgi:hypothetical protein